MPDSVEKRRFERFSLEFGLVVRSRDDYGLAFHEKTRLRDISGSGAEFLSRFPDRYRRGQPVTLRIELPDAEGLKAAMEAEATVVRVASAGTSPVPGSAWIAVNFDAPLRFDRTFGG